MVPQCRLASVIVSNADQQATLPISAGSQEHSTYVRGCALPFIGEPADLFLG
jgi:hypothetical protein